MDNKSLMAFLFVLAFISMSSFGVLAVLPDDLTILPGNGTYTIYTIATCTNAGETGVTLFRNGNDVTSNESGVNITFGVGDYTYDCHSNENATNVTKVLNISKSNTSNILYIEGSSSDITVDRDWTTNFTVVTNATSPENQLVELWTDYSDSSWKIWNSTATPLINLTKLTVLGTFGWYGNYSGNQNYTNSTSNSTITNYLKVTVTDIAPQISNYTTPEPANGSQYAPGIIYNFYLNVKDGSVDDVLFNSTASNDTITDFTQLDVNTRLYHATRTDLLVGNYPFRWYTNDTTGLRSETGLPNYSIVQNTSVPIWNFTTTTVTQGSTTAFSCWSSKDNVPNSSLTLYENSAPLTVLTLKPGIDRNPGTYNYWCNVTGNFNYATLGVATITVQSSGGGNNPGGSSPDTGPSLGVPEFNVQDLSDVSIGRGDTGTVTFNLVTANQPRSITDMQITLEGVDSSWYTVSPTGFTLDIDDSEAITITLTIPGDAEEKLYPVTVNVAGTEAATGTAKTASGGFVLTVGAGTGAGPTGAPFTLPQLTLPSDITGVIMIMGVVGGVVLYIYREELYGKMRNARRPSFRGYKPSSKPVTPQS